MESSLSTKTESIPLNTWHSGPYMHKMRSCPVLQHCHFFCPGLCPHSNAVAFHWHFWHSHPTVGSQWSKISKDLSHVLQFNHFSPLSCTIDFWTQLQDLPFIPIKFHLVRFRPSFRPVEIILDLGPVNCLPLCFTSSANLIVMLLLFSPKSSMEELGQRQGHGRLGHWRFLPRLVVINQSISIHWLPSFIQASVHWATLSSSPISPLSLLQYQGVLCQTSCCYPDTLC